MDNEYSRILTGGVTNMFANFGDWVPPPPAVRVSTDYTSAFSFLNDVRNVAFMAGKLGHTADQAKYRAIFSNVSSLFHMQWFNNTTKLYADGGQTAQVLALQLGLVPSAVRAAVVQGLVDDIAAHGNHTTCGIIGWRFECDVLAREGHGELAYALMTQRTYPSYGFEILHPDEPATTVWELWDGASEGPGMNSRDHIMFGGPGAWLYDYAAGISQAPDSIGFEHAVFTVPDNLVADALAGSAAPANSSAPLGWASASTSFPRGTYSIAWQATAPAASSCTAGAPEGSAVLLSCVGASIETVSFASYGTPTGSCAAGLQPSSCNADLTSLVSALCVGKESCSLECSVGSCNGKAVPDPCVDTVKHVSVQVSCAAGAPSLVDVNTAVPASAVADTVFPSFGRNASISEGGQSVWAAGAYVPGAAGVTGAVLSGDAVVVSHGSGEYQFQMQLS
eukprot:TRINITY_DN2101_c0_g1_i8.p1 TRINITY_DN2101_c0_g1~~TRINITY_DN2101_c0_g1_i8.p1  ORF type:complete len:450 (-),score=118.89 TRINITY_DN2101_c0_g1_i8:162-1511(-)